MGLAVLVTAFGVLTHHQQLGARTVDIAHTHAVLVHGLDEVLGIGALFALAALVLISAFIPGSRRVEPAAAIEPVTRVAEPVPAAANIEDERWFEHCRVEAG